MLNEKDLDSFALDDEMEMLDDIQFSDPKEDELLNSVLMNSGSARSAVSNDIGSAVSRPPAARPAKPARTKSSRTSQNSSKPKAAKASKTSRTAAAKAKPKKLRKTPVRKKSNPAAVVAMAANSSGRRASKPAAVSRASTFATTVGAVSTTTSMTPANTSNSGSTRNGDDDRSRDATAANTGSSGSMNGFNLNMSNSDMVSANRNSSNNNNNNNGSIRNAIGMSQQAKMGMAANMNMNGRCRNNNSGSSSNNNNRNGVAMSALTRQNNGSNIHGFTNGNNSNSNIVNRTGRTSGFKINSSMNMSNHSAGANIITDGSSNSTSSATSSSFTGPNTRSNMGGSNSNQFSSVQAPQATPLDEDLMNFDPTPIAPTGIRIVKSYPLGGMGNTSQNGMSEATQNTSSGMNSRMSAPWQQQQPRDQRQQPQQRRQQLSLTSMNRMHSTGQIMSGNNGISISNSSSNMQMGKTNSSFADGIANSHSSSNLGQSSMVMNNGPGNNNNNNADGNDQAMEPFMDLLNPTPLASNGIRVVDRITPSDLVPRFEREDLSFLVQSQRQSTLSTMNSMDNRSSSSSNNNTNRNGNMNGFRNNSSSNSNNNQVGMMPQNGRGAMGTPRRTFSAPPGVLAHALNSSSDNMNMSINSSHSSNNRVQGNFQAGTGPNMMRQQNPFSMMQM